ncbi:MAG: hypothetical protein AAFP76_10820 [Bacteroidota bacterium]
MNRLLPFLFLLLISLLGCKENPEESQSIEINDIMQGPILHDSLTEEQTEKITFLYETFKEVDPTPKEKWLEDFKRDLNPDREIEIWMMMANAYNSFCKDKNRSQEAKNEAFQIVILRSSAPEDQVLSLIELTHLTEEDAKFIMKNYTLEAKPIRVMENNTP